MSAADAQALVLEQAQARLARTRHALIAQMRHPAPEPSEDKAAHNAADGLRSVLRRWWQDHPAHQVLALLGPALQACARAYPCRTMALAAGLGAALVLLRPWRLLPLSALAVTAVRAMPLADLLAAWRAQAAQGQGGSAGQPPGPAA